MFESVNVCVYAKLCGIYSGKQGVEQGHKRSKFWCVDHESWDACSVVSKANHYTPKTVYVVELSILVYLGQLWWLMQT